MQNRRNKFKKALAKTLMALLIVGTIVGIMPALKASAATQHGIVFCSFMGETTDNGNGQSVYVATQHETKYVWGGQTVGRPANPVRSGYTFDGWYNDNTYSSLFNFNTPIYNSQAVYGRWIKPNVQFKAYDSSTGTVGVGGKITVSGTFPGTTATQVGQAASFTQSLYDDCTYTFTCTPSNGYYFRGWSVNSTSDGPTNWAPFSISPLWFSNRYTDGLVTLYAVFGKMGAETDTWTAIEGKTSEFKYEYSVSGAGVSANNLLILEDNNNITQTRWEGLTSDGKLPNSGNAKFIVTLKDNVPVGSYNVVLTNNVNNSVVSVTIVVKHRLQKWLPLAATCTTDGYNTYWECLECGKCFSDENATQETTREAMKVSAMDHNYGTWKYLNEIQHRHYCSHNNGHFETRNHSWSDGVITIQPTTIAEGVKIYTCSGCGATKTESVPKVVNTYTIKYHETDTSATSNLITSCTYGVATKTATISSLNFSTTGRSFQGWKIYREYDGKWWAKDASGKSNWIKEVPSDGEYILWPDGAEAKTTAPSGVVHFYAQWDNDMFTVKYHESDTAVASDLVTNCKFGIATKTATISNLNFSTTGRSFKGWKIYREYDGKWWAKDASGKSNWMKEVPSDGEYILWPEGAEATTTAPSGVVHFYAQWD